jgi:hypothetical protein
VDDEAAESAAVDGVSGSFLEVSVIDVLRRGNDVRYLSVHSLIEKGSPKRINVGTYTKVVMTISLQTDHTMSLPPPSIRSRPSTP